MPCCTPPTLEEKRTLQPGKWFVKKFSARNSNLVARKVEILARNLQKSKKRESNACPLGNSVDFLCNLVFNVRIDAFLFGLENGIQGFSKRSQSSCHESTDRRFACPKLQQNFAAGESLPENETMCFLAKELEQYWMICSMSPSLPDRIIHISGPQQLTLCRTFEQRTWTDAFFNKQRNPMLMIPDINESATGILRLMLRSIRA